MDLKTFTASMVLAVFLLIGCVMTTLTVLIPVMKQYFVVNYVIVCV